MEPHIHQNHIHLTMKPHQNSQESPICNGSVCLPVSHQLNWTVIIAGLDWSGHSQNLPTSSDTWDDCFPKKVQQCLLQTVSVCIPLSWGVEIERNTRLNCTQIYTGSGLLNSFFSGHKRWCTEKDKEAPESLRPVVGAKSEAWDVVAQLMSNSLSSANPRSWDISTLPRRQCTHVPKACISCTLQSRRVGSPSQCLEGSVITSSKPVADVQCKASELGAQHSAYWWAVTVRHSK